MSKLMSDIMLGALDGQLDMLATAIADRQRLVNNERVKSLKAGDFCKVSDSCSPQYLRGLKVEVIDYVPGRKKAQVRVVPEEQYKARRYAGERGFGCPLSLLVVV